MAQEKVNLRPDSFAEGGGLIDDFDGLISDIRFGLSPDGYVSGDPITLCLANFEVEDGEEHTELYTIGGQDDFAADDSGMGLVKLKGKSTLTKTSKLAMLLESLVVAGFPLNKMDEDNIGYLVGFRGHFLRKPVEYKGLKKKDDRENTVLLCTEIIKLPWESKGAAGKKGKASAKVDEGLADTVAGIIQGVIIDNDGEVAKKNMLSALFKNDDMNALENKKVALKLSSNDSFLKERDEWTYEDGILKMK